MVRLPDGRVVAKHGTSKIDFTGAKRLAGYQLRYIYFLNPEARNRLTVPILPFSAIDKMGAGMYLGKKKTRGGSVTVAQPAIQQEGGGSIPTSPHSTARGFTNE